MDYWLEIKRQELAVHGLDCYSRGMSTNQRFTARHLDELREEFSTLERINPDSPTYLKLVATLDRMTQPQLKQLVEAKIKFISGLARNRVKE